MTDAASLVAGGTGMGAGLVADGVQVTDCTSLVAGGTGMCTVTDCASLVAGGTGVCASLVADGVQVTDHTSLVAGGTGMCAVIGCASLVAGGTGVCASLVADGVQVTMWLVAVSLCDTSAWAVCTLSELAVASTVGKVMMALAKSTASLGVAALCTLLSLVTDGLLSKLILSTKGMALAGVTEARAVGKAVMMLAAHALAIGATVVLCTMLLMVAGMKMSRVLTEKEIGAVDRLWCWRRLTRMEVFDIPPAATLKLVRRCAVDPDPAGTGPENSGGGDDAIGEREKECL